MNQHRGHHEGEPGGEVPHEAEPSSHCSERTCSHDDHRAEKREGRDCLPEILITDRPMRDISRDSLAVLRDANKPPTLFVRSGTIVHLTADEHGRERIEITQPAHLRGRMDRAADYTKETKNGLKHATPPMSVVQDILSL